MASFPAELTDRIIDFLHSDKHALASCSLVCKSWVPTSWYHFFGEISITTVAKAQAFLELFESTNIDENGIGFFNIVRRISWSVTEPRCLTDSTIQIIASFPSLSELCLNSNSSSAFPSFAPLENMKKLTILGRLENVVPCVAIAIANNPNLECLDISSEELWNGPPMPQLHDLLVDIPPNSPPLQLRHLGVRGFRMHLDSRFLPHLRSLTSLELVNQKLHNNINSAECWRALKSERIQLSRLKTSAMSDELLEFLSSFQGLTDLHLERFTINDDEDSNRLAKIFFQVVLPHHTYTLKTLYINPMYQSDWCFWKHNVTSFVNCTNLRELGTSVYWRRGLGFSDGIPVEFVLNSTFDFPHLDTLRIYISHDPSHRRAICGNSNRREVALNAIEDAINRFGLRIGGGGSTRSPVSEIYSFQRKFEWREGKYHEVPNSCSWIEFMFGRLRLWKGYRYFLIQYVQGNGRQQDFPNRVNVY